MRIISGKFKGRQLKSFDAKHIRPTTDRVKESLFNKLQFEIQGSRVLDLFGGTGNLSIEAISRGASQVECVESHPQSVKIIKDNIQQFGIKNEILVHKMDVFKFIKSFTGEPFDIVLIDPPFTEALADSVLMALAKSDICKIGAPVFIESAKKEKVMDNYPSLGLIDRRFFGDKTLSIYGKTE